jgi:hypothetical protein
MPPALDNTAVLGEGQRTWTLDNFWGRPWLQPSDTFECCNSMWYFQLAREALCRNCAESPRRSLELIPFGPWDQVEIYLQSHTYGIFAQFGIALSTSEDPRILSFQSESYNPMSSDALMPIGSAHSFLFGAGRSGFDRFCSTSKLPTNLPDVTFTLYIRVLQRFADESSNDGIKQNCSPIPGFVGLKNEGMTGYLNAVLQMLYIIKPLVEVLFYPRHVQ